MSLKPEHIDPSPTCVAKCWRCGLRLMYQSESELVEFFIEHAHGDADLDALEEWLSEALEREADEEEDLT